MHLAYTDEQEELRRELRAYYTKLLDPETQAALAEDLTGPVMRSVVKQMAADGWLGIGWPTEYGGQGRGPMEQFIFFDESMRAGAPVPMLTINTVGPTIMNFGTDEQKNFFLPKILAGDIHFCIGYSEPGSGTDLAALRTTAVRDGDEYVINGNKMWTSYAQSADYCWLAVRTNTEVKKHKGLSMIIVAHGHPRHRGAGAAPHGRARDRRRALRRRAGAGRQPGGRREQRLDPHHQPAQPRAGHPVQPGHGGPHARPRCASGPRRRSCPTGAG